MKCTRVMCGMVTLSWLLGVSAILVELAFAEERTLVLEDFLAKEPDGFPSNWDHESQRSQSKGREAYKVHTENGAHFLSAKDAGQRIKKKKIDWDRNNFV